ncbi:SGNH/GDSL hydrolase family protein [Streptomyces sp. NPDC051940]|uniref:SGNH/GDSL hydrolase family protein n=1 Tax=Streptomyces sp. NPDC051940 TaxID=3155675 RepID=UPI003423F95E
MKSVKRWGPRVAFVVGAVLLVVVAASGARPWLLYVALVVFGVCSAVLVLRQLTWARDRSGVKLALLGAAVFVLGLVVLLAYFPLRVDWLPLAGSALTVIGLGWIIEWAREQRAGVQWWGGVAALAGTCVLLAVGVPLLLRPEAKGAGFVTPAVLLGVAVLLVLPVALNLLSEWGLGRVRRLRDSGEGGRLLRHPRLLGVPVLVAAAGYLAWLVSEDWMLAATLAGIGVALLLAIVSNTHADAALVLAGLCLVAAAPPEQSLPKELELPAGQRVLVAMGDSFMSGEGADSYFAGTDDAGGNECRRAPSAYAVRTVTSGRSPFDRLLFLACSGARTTAVVASSDDPEFARPQTGEEGTQTDQIKALGSRLRPALVIVSIGGNDAGFGVLAEACLMPGDCDTQGAVFTDNLPKVGRALTETYRSLKKALPQDVPVVAVPYPQPIAATGRCPGVALSKSERDFVRAFTDRLDAVVRSAAEAAGVHYLAEMKDSLATHRLQLCQGRKRGLGVNFVDVKSVNGPATQRFSPAKWLHNSLHPNETGHAAMRDTLETWLAAHPDVLKGSPPAPGSPKPPAPRGSVAEPTPQCGMTAAGESGCQTRLRAWQLDQIARLWPQTLGVLTAAGLIWLSAIAVLSRGTPRRGGAGTH